MIGDLPAFVSGKVSTPTAAFEKDVIEHEGERDEERPNVPELADALS
jgi:hypothetical protein